MSLRVKVEVVLFLIFGLVIGFSYAVQRFVIIPGLAPIEQAAAAREMSRCVETLRRQGDILHAQCHEWSASFPNLSTVAPGGVVEGLPGATPGLSDLSGAFVLSSERRLLWYHLGEDGAGNPVDLPDLTMETWPPEMAMFQGDQDNQGRSGILLTARGPALIAVSPLGSDEGLLVLCRLLDHDLLSLLYRQAAVEFQIWAVNDPALSQEERAVFQTLLAGDPVHVAEVGEESYRVYATYPDLRGNPVLLMRSDIHRNLLSRAEAAMQEGLLAQVGIGLAALGFLIILFRRTVMNPLSRLTAHAVHIGESNDLTARLSLERSDELGTLATEFNRMLVELEADRSYQAEVQEKLRESEERYALAVRGANDGLWDWDLLNDEVHYSNRWVTMLGYDTSEFSRAPSEWLDRVHPEDRENVLGALLAHKEGRTGHFESEHRVLHKGGNYIWILSRGLAVVDAQGRPTRMAGSQTDITLRKLFEEQLRHQALHDSLTSLPNRALFLDRVQQAIKSAERDKDHVFAIMFLDIDRFKVLNDGLGHVVGDTLLNLFAEKLQNILRAVDTVCRHSGTLARFGGDEFVLLLDQISGVGDATLVASRIEKVLSEPFVIGGHEVFTTVSIGIAMSGPGCLNAEELIRNADTAMYRAKAQGRACYEIFDSGMHSRAVERLQLENDLRRAIERDEFRVYYQPIVCLESGKIIAFESLVRWEHPERGLVSPLEFIPIAEETGMIVPIGEKVLRESCAQLKRWQDSLPEYRALRISVNLSVKEFAKPNLIGSIVDALTAVNLRPDYLKLEITESALMESLEYVTRTLRQIRDMNIELSIDDFGTGYSSLSYLHRFPMNTLKVDQAFIRDMMVSNESSQIVKTVILLAEALSMATIAEGIESAVQINELRGLRCEAGQGYYFARPLPRDEATALLESNPRWFQDKESEPV